jgi:hypothetical protein
MCFGVTKECKKQRRRSFQILWPSYNITLTTSVFTLYYNYMDIMEMRMLFQILFYPIVNHLGKCGDSTYLDSGPLFYTVILSEIR